MRKLVHDARDSLNSIALNSDMLARVLDASGEGADGRARRAAELVRQAAYRLADQMETLFEKRRSFDPVAVIREFARESGEDPEAPEVALVDLPEAGPTVEGGEDLLRRFLAEEGRRAAADGAALRLGLKVGAEEAIVLRFGRDGDDVTAALWLPVERGD